MSLPEDPIILLSYINTKLRDECKSLDGFCDKYEVDKALITSKLKSAVIYITRPLISLSDSCQSVSRIIDENRISRCYGIRKN